jgi:hypothetical protein
MCIGSTTIGHASIKANFGVEREDASGTKSGTIVRHVVLLQAYILGAIGGVRPDGYAAIMIHRFPIPYALITTPVADTLILIWHRGFETISSGLTDAVRGVKIRL